MCAAAGYKTIVREVDDIALNKGLGRIRKFLDDGVAKGKMSADARDKTLGGLSGTTTFSGLGECDLIVEAIIENLEDKRQAYAALEKIVPATPSSYRTRRRCASRSWRRLRHGRIDSADCTSSIRCR